VEKHMLTIENRENITITDVKSVDAFDEEEICVNLTEGGILIKGKELHIQMLDLDRGETVITGLVSDVSYTVKKAGGSFIKKILK